jgi:hypothetical protein
MPCRKIDLGDGRFAIACGRGDRAPLCSVCHQRRAPKLCDFPLTGEKTGRTCDRPLCEKCAVHQNPDIDYCPAHARMLEVAP